MTREFSARTRAANLDAMRAEPLDVLVMGGGIVGAWIALAAASRGHRVGLVEKDDFASGTSGRTSRLIHGGLRYLQRFRIGLVKQAARERDVLLRIAPGLVRPLPFLIPVYRDRGPKAWQIRLGLFVYDALSRDKVLPRRRWVDAEGALRLEPDLDPDGLVAAAVYFDALAHDARLVLAVVRQAANVGALVANYARVTRLDREGGRVAGAEVVDEETGRTAEIRARAVVNATGAWAPALQAERDRIAMRPTKGIHIFVSARRVGPRHAVVMPTPDGRLVFVLPWDRLALIGTTDTDFTGDPGDVVAARSEVDYLLEVTNAAFPRARLAPADVVSTYAGLRPLLDTGEAEGSDVSREHEVFVGSDGLLTVAGGKLTTARAMADDVLAHVERLVSPRPPRDTRTVRLDDAGAPASDAEALAVVPRLVRDEMVVHLDDAMVRRTRLFYEAEDHALRAAPRIANALGDELGWDAARRDREVERYRGIVAAHRRWREDAA